MTKSGRWRKGQVTTKAHRGMPPEVKKLGRIDMNMERREIPSVVLLSRPIHKDLQ